MLTQPKLIDITNTITAFTEIVPTLYTNSTQDMVTSILWNLQTDEEDGHTTLAIILDPLNSSLILAETEGNMFNLNSRYTLAGMATLNDLTFNIETVDTCVACDLGSKGESSEVDASTETTSARSGDKPAVFH